MFLYGGAQFIKQSCDRQLGRILYMQTICETVKRKFFRTLKRGEKISDELRVFKLLAARNHLPDFDITNLEAFAVGVAQSAPDIFKLLKYIHGGISST